MRRFLHRSIEFVKSPDRHELRLNREMREAFRTHFRDFTACCPDFSVQEFPSYLADFPHFGKAESASPKGLLTESEVCDALNQVSLSKSL